MFLGDYCVFCFGWLFEIGEAFDRFLSACCFVICDCFWTNYVEYYVHLKLRFALGGGLVLTIATFVSTGCRAVGFEGSYLAFEIAHFRSFLSAQWALDSVISYCPANVRHARYWLYA